MIDLRRFPGALALSIMLGGGVLRAQERPNHLLTIPPHFGRYHSEVYRRLLPSDAWRGPWMVVFPSFHPEYSAQVIPSDTAEPGLPSFIVRVTRSNVELWGIYGPQPPPPPPGVKDWPKRPRPSQVKIHSRETSLPSDVAEQVLNAWRHALLGTRNVEHPDMGCDGATYHFFLPPRMYGATWTPEGGLPADMVALGEALCRLVDAKEDQRSLILNEIRQLAARIINATT